MPTGLPGLGFITLTDGNKMPGRMRLDVYESAWERRVAEDSRRTANAQVPYNGTTNSVTVDMLSLSSSATVSVTDYKIIATIPDMSKETLGAGTISATIQGQDSLAPGWVAVASQAASGSSTSDTGGFQIEHLVSTLVYDQYRLQIITAGVSSNAVLASTCYLDFVFVGNQRRRVINIIGSAETNHASAFSDDMITFAGLSSLVGPVFYIAPNIYPIADMIRKQFSGTFLVDRISVDRGEGRHATVLLSLTQEGSWVDE